MSGMLPNIAGAGAAEEHHGGPHLHKTLWEGTKNFWRTRENVDVRIIEHTDANALEIIAFSVDRHEEADRVFLYADKVYKKLDNEELAERISAKREELSRMRKRVPNDEIKSGLLQELSVNYVLARLVPGLTTVPPTIMGRTSSPAPTLTASETITEDDNHSEGATSNEADSHHNEQDTTEKEAVTTDSGTNGRATATTNVDGETTEEGITESSNATATTEGESTLEAKVQKKMSAKKKEPAVCEPRFALEFIALTGDRKDPKTGFIDVLMTKDPPEDSIEHIVIKRARKKASTKEFNQALRSLRQDSHKLNAAMSDAQRKAGLAVSSVEGFQNFLSRATYDPETMSLARWRWVKSIRRVILQNAVAATTKRLERYSMSDFPSEMLAAEGNGPSAGGPRRLKPSSSTTKLPLLQQAKADKEKAKRKSMGSLRRIARGSREPRPINDFSSAFSGGLQTRAESQMNGNVLTSSDMMKKYGMSPDKMGLNKSESAGVLP